jgi:hypothetical protein
MKSFKLFIFLLYLNVKIRIKEIKSKAFWRHAGFRLLTGMLFFIIILYMIYIIIFNCWKYGIT